MSDLHDQIGSVFAMSRHGVKESVTLKSVTRSRVLIECVDTGKQKKMSIEKFNKFYEFKK